MDYYLYTLEETHGLMANVSPNFKGSPFSQLLPSLKQNELHDVHGQIKGRNSNKMVIFFSPQIKRQTHYS